MACACSIYLVSGTLLTARTILINIGYGDTSHLRTAVINTFRRKADFEMVVVPSSRVATSETHDRYLDISLHIKGASKMMVVMNKSDVSSHYTYKCMILN